MAVFEKRRGKDDVIKYRAKIRIKGRPTRSKTFSRLSDAKRWAQKVETQIQEGSYLPSAQKHTLAELIDRYLEEILPQKERRDAGDSASAAALVEETTRSASAR